MGFAERGSAADCGKPVDIYGRSLTCDLFLASRSGLSLIHEPIVHDELTDPIRRFIHRSAYDKPLIRRCVAMQQSLCDTLEADSHPRPGWRNWQTQRTQNPPTLAVMGVRPPLPAPTKQRV